jgi:hypothetical protein
VIIKLKHFKRISFLTSRYKKENMEEKKRDERRRRGREREREKNGRWRRKVRSRKNF